MRGEHNHVAGEIGDLDDRIRATVRGYLKAGAGILLSQEADTGQLAVSAAATAPTPTPTPTPAPPPAPTPNTSGPPIGALLWSAGHEGGSFAEWTAGGGGGEFNSDGGTSAISTEAARTGARSAKLTRPTAASHQGVRLFRWRESQNEIDPLLYSCWYHFPQRYVVNQAWWHVMQWKSGSAGTAAMVLAVANRPDGSMYLFLGRGSDMPQGGGAWHQNTADIPVGRWFNVTARMPKTLGTDGRVQVWQDGAPILDVSGLQTARVRMADGRIDMGWAVINYGQGGSPSPMVIYADDAAIHRSP